ncbi:hypothetical protein HPB50_004835 [Hyalomma asiaticum]|uniref:Uncharacterized protein n=1 Tax=Hyalomma asiaticum TaxID=266040 RepID=A0ACB7SJX2_HYAAI|nr:hypothetical protein HPB50_004835 [Hyalomma asiaticum]
MARESKRSQDGADGNSGVRADSMRTTEQEGPRFQEEPPVLVEFTNAKEAAVPCQAVGRPIPTVRWIKLPDGVAAAEVPGLRYMRPDGSLVFPKFAPKDFRQDVHATLYRCVATNSVGSIASRDVKVRADPERTEPRQRFYVFVGADIEECLLARPLDDVRKEAKRTTDLVLHLKDMSGGGVYFKAPDLGAWNTLDT